MLRVAAGITSAMTLYVDISPKNIRLDKNQGTSEETGERAPNDQGRHRARHSLEERSEAGTKERKQEERLSSVDITQRTHE